MSQALRSLTTDQLVQLLNQERRKFLVAIDYGATGSDLQEIRDQIKELETTISLRNPNEKNSKSERKSIG